MSLSFQIDVSGDDQVIKMLARLRTKLVDKTALHKSIGTWAENATRDHLIKEAQARHRTANRLGATPSGHLEPHGEKVTSHATDDAAIVSINIPGISRAFEDKVIKPGPGKKYLPIPNVAVAYNRRPRTFNDLRLAFFGRGKDGEKLLALVKAEQSSLSDRKESGGRSEVYYWLKKSVTQKQDRTLLPSVAQYAQAAKLGIMDYIRMDRTAAASS